MRMTASWLDSPVGSAEYKDVARAIFVPPLGRLASGRLVFACYLANAHALNPDALRACRRARAGREVAWKCCRTLNGLSDGHP